MPVTKAAFAELVLDKVQEKHDAQRALPDIPDEEELEVLAEEALRLADRLQRICNRMTYGQPSRSHILRHCADSLKLTIDYIRDYIANDG